MDPSATQSSRRRRLTLLLAPIVALVIASNVGQALWPALAEDHPLLLITLNASNRYLALTTNSLDAVSYYVVGSLRLLVSDPLFYLLGWWYGDAALSWVEKRSKGTGELLRSAERWFGKAAYVLVFVAPNNYICLFAGASRLRPWLFFTVNAAGTVTRLVIIRMVGEVFADPIDQLLGFLSEYRWEATAVTIAIVVIQVMRDRRRGTSELETVGEMERELESEIDQAGEAPDER